MKLLPPDQLGPTFDEYFPERDALHKELDRLNQIVKTQRSSADAWKQYRSAARTSNEYGGLNYYSRKEKNRDVFFNPWYRSSNEIGKYLGEPSKEDKELLSEALKENDFKNTDDKSKEAAKSGEGGYKLPPLVTASGNLKSTRDIHPSRPRPERSNKEPSVSRSNNSYRQQLLSDPVMKNPMGKLWQSINDPPRDTTQDKRGATKVIKTREQNKKKLHEHVNFSPRDHVSQFGIGKTYGFGIR